MDACTGRAEVWVFMICCAVCARGDDDEEFKKFPNGEIMYWMTDREKKKRLFCSSKCSTIYHEWIRKGLV